MADEIRARNEPPLQCYYCNLGPDLTGCQRPDSNPGALATVTVHDPRGCLHVCWKHAEWRMTTSFGFGHSRDCPYYREGK